MMESQGLKPSDLDLLGCIQLQYNIFFMMEIANESQHDHFLVILSSLLTCINIILLFHTAN